MISISDASPASHHRQGRRQCNLEIEDLWVPGALLSGLLLYPIYHLVKPKDDLLDGGTLGMISSIIGWTYFWAWTVSFYPQIFLNFKLKSVAALSLEYQLFNLVGFGFYFAFTYLLHSDGNIREEYRRSHSGHNPQVRLNDVLFAGHAFVITIVTLLQIFLYWDYPALHGSALAVRRTSLMGLFLLLAAVGALAAVVTIEKERSINWLMFLTWISAVKVGISVVKYCPQVLLNIRRKSTEGWTIHNILLDFIGGSLSVAQLLLDAGRTNDWSAVTGNPAKLMLGNVSMFFDVIFMVQHFCFYRKDRASQLRPLEANLCNAAQA